MEINGMIGSAAYAQSRTNKNANAEKEAPVLDPKAARQAAALKEKEEMDAFKKKFYEDISQIRTHRTVANLAIQVTQEGFEAMKNDPEYYEKMISLLERDLGSNYSPPGDASLLIKIGGTSKEYRGDSWSVTADSEFDMRSVGSFYKKTSNTKPEEERQILEEYLEKRRKEKKVMRELRQESILKAEQDQALLRRKQAAAQAYDTQGLQN